MPAFRRRSGRMRHWALRSATVAEGLSQAALPLDTSPAFLPLQCETLNCTPDRKSTRLNSSHLVISYAVFCLKKKIAHLFPSNQSNLYWTRFFPPHCFLLR